MQIAMHCIFAAVGEKICLKKIGGQEIYGILQTYDWSEEVIHILAPALVAVFEERDGRMLKKYHVLGHEN